MSTSCATKKCTDLTKEFSRLKDICYLDHVGSGLYADSQLQAIFDDLKSNLYGNPHSSNVNSKYCKDAVDQIRFKILEHFCTNTDEFDIIFTSGATQALKLVAEWFSWNNNEEGDNFGNFVYTQDNHTSVLGLREIVAQQHNNIFCIEHDEVFRIFKQTREDKQKSCGNSLFVYPAQCNFSGCKYPLTWIEKVHEGVLDNFIYKRTNKICTSKWFCLLDASSFVPTNKLNLSLYKPDFLTISFYKIFGYPTGLGALLVKKSSEAVLNKKYYGGGTVLITLSNERFHRKRSALHERSEDGTINYLSILSLKHGFDTVKRLGGSMEEISKKVFRLTQYLHDKLLTLHHSNGNPAVIIYHDTDYHDKNTQGNIINFNLIRSNGEYIGYSEVLNIANLYKIQLRTGCFCNPGACQRHLKLKNEHLIKHFQRGHTCMENIDLIDGYPTGSIRVSFGYMSEINVVHELINMITECFVTQPAIFKIPCTWEQEAQNLKEKFIFFKHLVNNFEQKINENDSREKNASFINNENEAHISLNVKMNLSKIYIYPIKSCAAFNVTYNWPLSEIGLKFDREWMIISDNGVVLSQKQIPQMCLITPHIDLINRTMTLKFKTKEKSTITINLDKNIDERIKTLSTCQSKVCNDKVNIIDWGDEVANWLELTLGKPGVRLVKLKSRNKSEKNVPLSLANQAQYLLITKSSVEWLFDQMSETITWELDDKIKAFRSNFVISGNIKPLEEFKWKEITIGSLKFKVTGLCHRCQMICINQSSGEQNKEPLITLTKVLKGKINFGIYLSLIEFKTDSFLKIGEAVNSSI